MKWASFALLLFLAMATAAEAGQRQKASLETKIGQMVMVGFRGLDATTEPRLADDIRKRGIGGVVLFDYDVPSASPVRNIESATQVSMLVAELQSMAAIPLFIAIDQEGGRVARLKAAKGFPQSPSAAHLGALDNADSTAVAASSTGALLASLGINMDLAPDVDLNVNPENPVIGRLERSFSADPAVVTRHARIFVRELRAAGVIPVLKHFPGHGSSTADTHKEFTDVTASWTRAEIEPYRALIREGYADPVMTAHIFNAGLDSLHPATLSGKVIDGLLRHDLHFKGAVISDDLQMKAIADRYGLESSLLLAIDAGADILLFGNNAVDYDPEIAEKAIRTIADLVDRGMISPKRIDQSYQRIISLKQKELRVTPR